MDHPAERQAMPQKPSNSRPAGNCEVIIRRRNWLLLDSSQPDLPIAGLAKLRQTGIMAGLFTSRGAPGIQSGVIR